MNLSSAFLFVRAIPKTVLFNLRYFSLRQALCFPVIVSHRVWFARLGGKVVLRAARLGGVRIGFNRVGIFDQHRSRTIWEVSGVVEFAGSANIGHGSKISVLKDGHLRLGNNFTITAESTLIVEKKISVGDNVLISWDVQIMDTDFHAIRDATGLVVNPPKDVTIQDDVWIGCRALVLKGVTLPSGSIVAAGSIVTKSPDRENAILASAKQRIVKDGIFWR
jgi:acetyltransferase-like isoleucine patch superfamily enzyme